ncbi:hypothetical protein TWF730_006626 [Orbilia blumenaviensis]|uniref:Uncharacterized protein n=1 Tax=Orbilia blumenaviensis TaxID=1796055 RepID=A0AAV9VEV2_9PEZI
MSRKIFLTFLAVISAVNSQSNPCNASSTTVETQADLDILSVCSILTGDLILGTNLVTADINGIRTIQGDLVAANAFDLQRITAPDLAHIGGDFNLTSLTILSHVNIDSLDYAAGLHWRNLPSLTRLEPFYSKLTHSSRFSITDTGLQSFYGPNFTTAENVQFRNNKNLLGIVVNFHNTSGSLAFIDNPLAFIRLPELVLVKNATFRSNSGMELPKLTTVTGSVEFSGNGFETLIIPKLQTIGAGDDPDTEETFSGNLTIVDNKNATTIKMLQLTEIFGNLQFVGNSVENVDGFPLLLDVHGSIDARGNFSKITFPSMRDIRGDFNIQTNAEFDCSDDVDRLAGGIVKGGYFCKGATSRGGSKPTPVGAVVGGTVGGLLVIAAVAGFLFYRRRKVKSRKAGLAGVTVGNSNQLGGIEIVKTPKKAYNVVGGVDAANGAGGIKT